MAGSCSYTHDISGERFADHDGDRWSCPRETTGDARFCPFHRGPDHADTEALSNELRALVESQNGPVELIGAQLSGIDLRYAILDGPSNHPIDLRDSIVDGPVDFTQATIRRPLRLAGAELDGDVSFERATLDRQLSLVDCTLGAATTFEFAGIDAWFDVSRCAFHGPVVGRVAEFSQGIVAEETTFHDAADFMAARFRGAANFHGAVFTHGGVFDSAEFDADLRLDRTTLSAPTVQTVPASDTSLVDGQTVYDDRAFSLSGAVCRQQLRFDGVSADGTICLAELSLGGELRTVGLSASRPLTVDCRSAETIRGAIDDCDETITYDLTGATVGPISFEADTTIEALCFEETRFDGFDFGAHRESLDQRDWLLHDPETDRPVSQRETLYLRAKNGATEIGETRIAAEFFVHEMRYRRRGHWRQLTGGEGIGERLRAGGRWLGNLALGLTCGYGERPFRPVVFSLGIVAVFAGLYALIQPQLSYSNPAGFVIFSAEGFVSLILGLPASSGTIVSLLVVTEAFLGGFVVALFVFTLTRSISR